MLCSQLYASELISQCSLPRKHFGALQRVTQVQHTEIAWVPVSSYVGSSQDTSSCMCTVAVPPVRCGIVKRMAMVILTGQGTDLFSLMVVHGGAAN